MASDILQIAVAQTASQVGHPSDNIEDRCRPPARKCLDYARKCFDAGGPGNSLTMIILGLVLLLLGFVLSIPILWTIGLILLIVGAVLMLLGRGGRQVGGRAHYW